MAVVNDEPERYLVALSNKTSPPFPFLPVAEISFVQRRTYMCALCRVSLFILLQIHCSTLHIHAKGRLGALILDAARQGTVMKIAQGQAFTSPLKINELINKSPLEERRQPGKITHGPASFVRLEKWPVMQIHAHIYEKVAEEHVHTGKTDRRGGKAYEQSESINSI